VKVRITYFKPTGKYYTTEDAEWEEDPAHYSGWKPFIAVVRMQNMIAVCLDSPLGYPVCHNPAQPTSL
jgi:hypothetical protein